MDRFEEEWLSDLGQTFDRFRGDFTCDDERGLFTEFKEHLERAERHYGRIGRPRPMASIYVSIDEHLATLPGEDEDWDDERPTPAGRAAAADVGTREDVFSDIDE